MLRKKCADRVTGWPDHKAEELARVAEAVREPTQPQCFQTIPKLLAHPHIEPSPPDSSGHVEQRSCYQLQDGTPSTAGRSNTDPVELTGMPSDADSQSGQTATTQRDELASSPSLRPYPVRTHSPQLIADRGPEGGEYASFTRLTGSHSNDEQFEVNYDIDSGPGPQNIPAQTGYKSIQDIDIRAVNDNNRALRNIFNTVAASGQFNHAGPRVPLRYEYKKVANHVKGV